MTGSKRVIAVEVPVPEVGERGPDFLFDCGKTGLCQDVLISRITGEYLVAALAGEDHFAVGLPGGFGCQVGWNADLELEFVEEHQGFERGEYIAIQFPGLDFAHHQVKALVPGEAPREPKVFRALQANREQEGLVQVLVDGLRNQRGVNATGKKDARLFQGTRAQGNGVVEGGAERGKRVGAWDEPAEIVEGENRLRGKTVRGKREHVPEKQRLWERDVK